MFEDFEFEEKFNPWDVKSIEDFRFYCCPECSTRNVHKSDFIRHALTFHPKFQNIFDKLEDNKGDVKPIKTEMTASETVTENVSNEPTSASNSSVTESSVTKDETVDGQSKELQKDIPQPKSANIFSTNLSDNKELQENINPVNLIQSIPKVPQATVSYSNINADNTNVPPMSLQTHTLLEHPKAGEVPMVLKIDKNDRYNCDKCNKSFFRKANLKTHIKNVHENVRYNCDKCDKSFSWKHHLNRHIKSVHNNECNILNDPSATSIYTRAKRVKREMQKNDQQSTKLFESKESEEEFLDFLKLDNPLEGKIENTGFNCDMCGKCYSTKGNLKKHIQSVHEKV